MNLFWIIYNNGFWIYEFVKKNKLSLFLILLTFTITIIPLVSVQAFPFKESKASWKDFFKTFWKSRINKNAYVTNSTIKSPPVYILPPISKEKKDMEKIRDLTNQVNKNHTYTYNSVTTGDKKWNCLDYSIELTKLLTENGFEASCVFGNYADNPDNLYKIGNAHNWVIVNYSGKIIPLDPTFGTMPSDYDYKLHYKPILFRCI